MIMKKLFLLLALLSCLALGCQESTPPADTPAAGGSATEDAESTTPTEDSAADEAN